MHTTLERQRFTVYVFGVFSALLGLSFPVHACSTPPASSSPINLVSWQAAANVHVVISGFPGFQDQDVVDAVSNWDNGLSAAGSLCYAPYFSTSGGSDGTWNVNYQFLGPDPTTGATRRGLTSYNGYTGPGGNLNNASTTINNQVTVDATITEVAAHELGHTMALGDCTQCGVNTTVMESGDVVHSINDSIGTPGPTPCDTGAIINAVPNYDCQVAGCDPEEESLCLQGGGNWDNTDCSCTGNSSPIIVNLGEGPIKLTSACAGVSFDVDSDGRPEQVAWTQEGEQLAFLVLDRNGNGLIDNGTELFGNFTPQPPSKTPNGFLALAVFDDPKNGGNGDGIIDQRDAVFSKLRLWIDSNHDGISQPSELITLEDAGIDWISLAYSETTRIDQYGNMFKYRTRIHFREQRGDPWIYDVFLKRAMGSCVAASENAPADDATCRGSRLTRIDAKMRLTKINFTHF